MISLAPDQTGAHFGDCFGFGITLLLGAGLAVFVGDGDVQGRDTQALAAIGVKGVEGGKAWLAFGRQHGLEALVDDR